MEQLLELVNYATRTNEGVLNWLGKSLTRKRRHLRFCSLRVYLSLSLSHTHTHTHGERERERCDVSPPVFMAPQGNFVISLSLLDLSSAGAPLHLPSASSTTHNTFSRLVCQSRGRFPTFTARVRNLFRQVQVFSPNQGAHFTLRDKMGRGTTLNKGYPLS